MDAPCGKIRISVEKQSTGQTSLSLDKSVILARMDRFSAWRIALASEDDRRQRSSRECLVCQGRLAAASDRTDPTDRSDRMRRPVLSGFFGGSVRSLV